MTRDLLQEATRALGESGHDQKGARFTRERLMASLHERKQRSKSRFALLLPLAAIFVGSTAFAAVTGQLEVLVLSALDIVGAGPAHVEEQRAASLPERKPPGRQASSRPAPAGPPSALPAVPEVAMEQPEPPSELSPKSEAKRSVPLEHTVGTPSVPEPDDAHAVYRRAHRAQFSKGDVTSALADYDAYLAEQPRGRFAVDARYNRALCLVRLGRTAEARVELEKFAQGAHGGYRKHDAERLLGALDQVDPVLR